MPPASLVHDQERRVGEVGDALAAGGAEGGDEGEGPGGREGEGEGYHIICGALIFLMLRRTLFCSKKGGPV
jgi:hypothetical protein